MKLSVLIPVYNEARTIDEILRLVVAEKTEKEIIVVDDGSTDGTREKLAAWDGKSGVRVILHEKNAGKGRAVRTAMDASRGEILVIQDADLEYDPSEYPLLLRPIEAGRADVVFGSRFAGSAEHRVQHFWHVQGNRLLTAITNVFTGLNLSDMATCYKAFHRRVAAVSAARVQGIRHRRGDHREGGPRKFPRLRGPDLLLRSLQGGRQEDPAQGRVRGALGARAAHRLRGPIALSDPKRLAPLAAILLVGVSVWLVRDHTREDSLSADEPIHILSGYFAVASRSAIVNIEHPPLMKALSGLALATLPLRPPPGRVPMGNLFLDYGPEFFYANRVPPDAIIAAARAPFLAVLAGLLALVYVSAQRRYGAAAALFAAALCALDPNLVAHAGVVHTDLGAALAFLATVLSWEAARRRPDAPRLLLAAVCLGLALTTKFSAVYLLPILLLQTLIAARRQTQAGRVGRELLRLLAVCAGALVVVVAVYAAVTARMDPGDQAIVIRDKVGAVGRAPALAERIVALARVSKPLAHYVGGLASVVRQNAVGGGVTFLNGRISTEGFPQYFLVAFGVKSALAFLAITAAILWALLRRAGLAEEARLFLLPVVVLFLASIGTTYNIGIRHLLPVYPFLALFGAALFARAWERRRASGRARIAAVAWVALPVVSAAELARIHPHELSYFNPLAGGPVAGSRILSDSNVDWGLDLIRLAEELKRRGVSEPTVAYFGGDRVDYRLRVPAFQADPVVRGKLLALSVFLRTAGPEFYAYHGSTDLADALRELQRKAASGRLVGRIGYSIELFELPQGDSP